MVNRSREPLGASDGDLVSAARAGSAQAFSDLVARYQDRIHNTCLRMCGHGSDALDLTQATFLKAFESLPQFEGRANFFTWLFRIALNVSLSHRRTQRRRGRVKLESDVPDAERFPRLVAAAMPADSPSRRMEMNEEQERVAAALGQLEEEFRAAVVLKDVEGLDYAGIAQILEIPVGTVKSRVHRGRMVLRDLLLDETRKQVGP